VAVYDLNGLNTRHRQEIFRRHVDYRRIDLSVGQTKIGNALTSAAARRMKSASNGRNHSKEHNPNLPFEPATYAIKRFEAPK
jgi:hypothetical protein